MCREMAVGNTFGATALSSYGGFWLAFAIVLTPGGFQIESALEEAGGGTLTVFHNSFSLFLWVCAIHSQSYAFLIRRRAGSSSQPFSYSAHLNRLSHSSSFSSR